MRSGYVIAFKNVWSDPLRRWANGSLEGYFLDPQSTESFVFALPKVQQARESDRIICNHQGVGRCQRSQAVHMM